MTKNKKIVWRLKDLPTGDEVAELVKVGVLTKDEAREILLVDDTSDPQKIKELEEEVKFLRKLADKLAGQGNHWTTIVREIGLYTPKYPTWYANYSNLQAPTYTTTTTGTTGSTASYSLNAGGNVIDISHPDVGGGMLAKLN